LKIKRFISWIKKNFVTGIITILPFALTIYIIYFFIIKTDNLLGGYLLKYFNLKIPGLGFIIIIFVIFILGLLVRNYLGAKLLLFSEYIIDKMPFINRLYKSIKHVTTSLIGSGKNIFKSVVLIEYPRKGVYSLGFVTENMNNSFNEKINGLKTSNYYAIFIPSTPNPTTGYLLYIKKKEVIQLDITVEEAMKIILSGAIVKGKQFGNTKGENK
jgi:uncharacterized membrane protein